VLEALGNPHGEKWWRSRHTAEIIERVHKETESAKEGQANPGDDDMKPKMVYFVGTYEAAQEWCREHNVDYNDPNAICVIAGLQDTRKLRGRSYSADRDSIVWSEDAVWWTDDDRMRIDQQFRMMRDA
jgi:hypothetical protein